jgi:hypothetical protein
VPAFASAISAFAAAGSDSITSSAMPRLIAAATRRTCAPSCRSRSMRRSSTAEASTAAVLVAVSSSTRADSAAAAVGSSSAAANRACPTRTG